MYTRCTECKTVFHITAAELRAADGTVICGACGSTFDALESLSETRPADPAPGVEPVFPDAEEPEPAEFVRDEDEFLEELESLIGPDATDEELEARDRYGSHHIDDDREDEPADEEFIDDDLDIEPVIGREMGPAREIKTDPEIEPEIEPELGPAIGTEDGTEDESDEFNEHADFLDDDSDEDLDDVIPDPDSVFRVDDVPEEFAAEDEEPFVGVEAPPPTLVRGNLHRGSAEPAEHVEPAAPSDESAEASGEHEDVPDFDSEPRRSRIWPKALVLILVLLALAVTWAHSQHGKLLRLPAGQAVLEPVYQRLGINATADWDLAAYRAIQWEAVADADRPDDLAVAVDFQNTAPFAQPYPIIRIMLDDRFGRRLGMHDIPPTEYQRDHATSARMPSGGRVRTTVVVPDPSGRAASFRVDFCLELAGRGLACGPQPFR